MLLFGAVSVAIYAAIYGINRPFDDRIAEIGIKMRVTYGNPANPTPTPISFANGLFRWVAKHLPEPAMNTPEAREARADADPRRLSGLGTPSAPFTLSASARPRGLRSL